MAAPKTAAIFSPVLNMRQPVNQGFEVGASLTSNNSRLDTIFLKHFLARRVAP